jgi:hypothetical protein
LVPTKKVEQQEWVKSQTNAPMHIPASKTPAFKAGKTLKDAVKKIDALIKKGPHCGSFYVYFIR